MEQLEGFQSQELAKVKHMLLSAETALDTETHERKKLETLLKEARVSVTDSSVNQHSDVEHLIAEHQRQLQIRDERAQVFDWWWSSIDPALMD